MSSHNESPVELPAYSAPSPISFSSSAHEVIALSQKGKLALFPLKVRPKYIFLLTVLKDSWINFGLVRKAILSRKLEGTVWGLYDQKSRIRATLNYKSGANANVNFSNYMPYSILHTHFPPIYLKRHSFSQHLLYTLAYILQVALFTSMVFLL